MPTRKSWSLTDRLLEGGGDRVNPSRRSAVGSRLSPAYTQEAQRNRMFGGGGARNPAAQASQRMDPANTRKVVSKIINQFNQRDTQDRQGRFSAPSPARIAERSGTDTISSGGGFYGDRQYYNRATYEQTDISGSGQQPAYIPASRGGRGDYADPTVPTRSMGAPPSPKSPAGMKRRQASTQTAYHLADSAPLKDYKPRGKTIADKKTNIQAFY